MRPTRESDGANQLLFPYLALLRTGFARAIRYRMSPWSLTPRFHPYPARARRFSSLWHFPSDRSAPALPGVPILWSSDFPHNKRKFTARLFSLLSVAFDLYNNITTTNFNSSGHHSCTQSTSSGGNWATLLLSARNGDEIPPPRHW